MGTTTLQLSCYIPHQIIPAWILSNYYVMVWCHSFGDGMYRFCDMNTFLLFFTFFFFYQLILSTRSTERDFYFYFYYVLFYKAFLLFEFYFLCIVGCRVRESRLEPTWILLKDIFSAQRSELWLINISLLSI